MPPGSTRSVAALSARDSAFRYEEHPILLFPNFVEGEQNRLVVALSPCGETVREVRGIDLHSPWRGGEWGSSGTEEVVASAQPLNALTPPFRLDVGYLLWPVAPPVPMNRSGSGLAARPTGGLGKAIPVEASADVPLGFRTVRSELRVRA